MSEHTIDLSGKSLMCYNEGTIQCDSHPVKLFYRDGTIVTVFPSETDAKKYAAKNTNEKVSFDSDYKINLKDLIGMTCQDFRLSFHLLPEDKIEEYQNDPEEKWF